MEIGLYMKSDIKIPSLKDVIDPYNCPFRLETVAWGFDNRFSITVTITNGLYNFCLGIRGSGKIKTTYEVISYFKIVTKGDKTLAL